MRLENYKINQAHISQSVADFNWQKRFNLREYYDSSQPCLFIGMYYEKDIEAVTAHSDIAVIKWCGYDSKMVKDFDPLKADNIRHITIHPKVQRRLKRKGINAKLIDPYVNDVNVYQGKSGRNVFAYCPPTTNNYHRTDIINKLSKQFNIIRGDGSISQLEWHAGKKYKIYNRCYIGLVLNNYAGGLSTIHELMLQGKYCITNVANSPNCIKWRTVEDIITHLNNKKYFRPDPTLLKLIDFYNFEPEWLNLKYYD